jgi:hypothetical protein
LNPSTACGFLINFIVALIASNATGTALMTRPTQITFFEAIKGLP